MNADLRRAILLLLATESIIKKRRFYEQACGFRENSGGDRLLVEQIRMFLDSDNVKEDVTRLEKEFSC